MNRMLGRTYRWGLGLATLALVCLSTWADTPSGKTIAEVVTLGNQGFSSEEILSHLQTKAGNTFSHLTAEEDVRRLYGKGWFEDVRIDTQVRADGTLTVFVRIKEYQSRIEEIIFQGAQHISKGDLLKFTGLKRGAPMSPIANQTACQALLRKYHEMGRLNASVRLLEGNKKEDKRVVIDIVEGQVVRVSGIDFKFLGTPSGDVTKSRLRTQVNTSSAFLKTFGGQFDAVKIEFDQARIREYYQRIGYLDARVSRELIWAPDHRTVEVVFHIEEGPRYKVGDVDIEGNKVFEKERLLGLTDTRPNVFYDKLVVQSDLRRIRDLYGYTGRQVPIEEKIVADPEQKGVVHVSYQVQERPPVRVGEVIVEGNEVTRQNVILRQVPLFPGQILSYPDLLAAEQNLSRLGIFEDDPATGVRPTVTVDNPDIDEPFKTVRVRVKEKPTGSFLLGVGVNSDAGVTGSIVLNEKNFDIANPPSSLEELLSGRAFRGANQELRLEAVPGNQFQRYTASIREPSVFDSPYSLGVSGYYYQRGFLEYNESRLGARVTVGRRLTNFWSANFTTRVEDVGVFDLSQFAPFEITKDRGHSFLVGTRFGLNYDTRDNYLRPTSGTTIDLGYEQVFGDNDFPLLTAEASKFFTTYQRVDGSGRHVLALRSQLSYAGDQAPVYERFYAGGFRSLRGFTFRGVGPRILDFNIGGNFAFLNSAEYQIPVLANDNLYFVAFVDSGTVERDVSIRNYRVTAGVGARIAVPQLLGPVPIALDFGFPITDSPSDNRQLFSFWLGFFN